MKGWCVIPERMNSNDFGSLSQSYTIPGHTRNKRALRNFSDTTQMFTRESPHHLGVRDYFSRRKALRFRGERLLLTPDPLPQNV